MGHVVGNLFDGPRLCPVLTVHGFADKPCQPKQKIQETLETQY